MRPSGIESPPRNTSRRCDCPQCGGFNTLSVSNKHGKIYYHCFRACCNFSGVDKSECSIEDMRSSGPVRRYVPTFSARFPTFTPISTLCRGHAYLVANGCLDQYEKEPERFFYDVKSDRVVFIEYDDAGNILLATGRSLIGEKPKWYKYVAEGHPTFVATTVEGSHVAFVVEDCASACSVGRVGLGVALCGTSWNTQTLAQTLQRIGAEEVNICLDEDAQSKSLRLKFELEGSFSKVRLLPFSDDAKYLTRQQVEREYNDSQEAKEDD